MSNQEYTNFNRTPDNLERRKCNNHGSFRNNNNLSRNKQTILLTNVKYKNDMKVKILFTYTCKSITSISVEKNSFCRRNLYFLEWLAKNKVITCKYEKASTPASMFLLRVIIMDNCSFSCTNFKWLSCKVSVTIRTVLMFK